MLEILGWCAAVAVAALALSAGHRKREAISEWLEDWTWRCDKCGGFGRFNGERLRAWWWGWMVCKRCLPAVMDRWAEITSRGCEIVKGLLEKLEATRGGKKSKNNSGVMQEQGHQMWYNQG